MESRPSRFAHFSRLEASRAAAAFGILLAAALAASFLWPSVVERLPLGCSEGLHTALSMDYELYGSIIDDVRRGENFYDASNVHLRAMGGRIGSVFNWRLPTYAYLAALLPHERSIRVAVLSAAALALGLALVAEWREVGPVRAIVLVVLLAGVFHWCLDGLAFYAQEVWVAILFTISLSATARAEQAMRGVTPLSKVAACWSALAVGSGLLALFCRELALPFCVAAGGVAWCYRRRGEAIAWFVGIVAFGAVLAWHTGQVHAQLTALDRSASSGPWEWIVVGGLGTVLMTARMASFLYVAPNWLLVTYVWSSLLGLCDSPQRHCSLAAVATLLYLGAFCIVGLDINFYWGLMYAALLPFGLVRFPQAAQHLFLRTRASQTPVAT